MGLINRLVTTLGWNQPKVTPTPTTNAPRTLAQQLSISNDSSKKWMLPGVVSKIAEGAKKALTWRIKRQYIYIIKAEMDKFRQARESAEYPMRPDRRDLYAIYHDICIDDQIVTQHRVCTNTIIRAPFQVVDAQANPNKKAKELFERPWFLSYLKHEVDTEFYGHSLIEFNPEMRNGEFTDLTLMPRPLVRPEFGDILLNQNDPTGVNYRDANEYPYTVELGEPDDLGILLYCTIPAIRKKYSDTDWSLASEKFGMPFLVVKTQSRNDTELDAKEMMAKNFGSNGYAILDDQDEIAMLERTGNANAHLIYLDRIRLSDEQMAKIINGQNSTSDVKAFVGSAEVHERILNDFTFARMKRIEYNINFVLIPFLIRHGYALKGTKYQFKELLEKEKMENEPDPLPGPSKDKKAPVKKKSSVGATVAVAQSTETTVAQSIETAVAQSIETTVAQPIETAVTPKPNTIYNKVLNFYNTTHCCNEELPIVQLGINLDSIIERVIKDIYNEKISRGELSADLWKLNADALLEGVDTAFAADTTTAAAQLQQQLRQNIMVFSAFKNHANMTDIFNLLLDNSGVKRLWADFKKEALQISKNYNEAWLQTEYQTAVGTARMASRWQHIKEDFGEDVMLRFETVGDDKVRDAHKILDGVTKPLTDSFWKTFYPPVGWNCRCDAVAVPGEAEIDMKRAPSEKEVPLEFRNNAGETGEVFSDEHPYFDVDKKTTRSIMEQYHKIVK
jgi:SPP1 gp7 family putative phage head morphogenesis protein